MKVTFLLPGPGTMPTGGFKVVYRYANESARMGNLVRIIHLAMRPEKHSRRREQRGPGWIAWFLAYKLTRRYRPDAWLKLDPRVKCIWVPRLKNGALRRADVVVATAAETAEVLAAVPPEGEERFYLIQGFDDWAIGRDRVVETWRLPFRKLVVSRWLGEIAASLGVDCTYMPNGLDLDLFGLDVPPEERTPASIVMLYHAAPGKGVADGLEALGRIANDRKDLQVTLFGTYEPPELPTWATYVRNPASPMLRKIYNSAAIVVAPSHAEGWGLVPAEGMLSGCAVAATDCGGHREFVMHGSTGLMSPVGDWEQLASNISELIENQDLRMRLARKGHAYVQRFSWARAGSRMRKEFERAVAERVH